MKHLNTYTEHLFEANEKLLYQYRDIGAGVWYKKLKNDKLWTIIEGKEFDKCSNESNIIKYKNKYI